MITTVGQFENPNYHVPGSGGVAINSITSVGTGTSLINQGLPDVELKSIVPTLSNLVDNTVPEEIRLYTTQQGAFDESTQTFSHQTTIIARDGEPGYTIANGPARDAKTIFGVYNLQAGPNTAVPLTDLFKVDTEVAGSSITSIKMNDNNFADYTNLDVASSALIYGNKQNTRTVAANDAIVFAPSRSSNRPLVYKDSTSNQIADGFSDSFVVQNDSGFKIVQDTSLNTNPLTLNQPFDPRIDVNSITAGNNQWFCTCKKDMTWPGVGVVQATSEFPALPDRYTFGFTVKVLLTLERNVGHHDSVFSTVRFSATREGASYFFSNINPTNVADTPATGFSVNWSVSFNGTNIVLSATRFDNNVGAVVADCVATWEYSCISVWPLV